MKGAIDRRLVRRYSAAVYGQLLVFGGRFFNRLNRTIQAMVSSVSSVLSVLSLPMVGLMNGWFDDLMSIIYGTLSGV
jgi:hypothetical protein